MSQTLTNSVKGLVASIIAIALLLLSNNALAITNTQSLDLERSSNQYLTISDGSQTGLDISGDFTFEAWIKIEDLSSSYYNLLQKGDNYTDPAYVFTLQEWDTNDYRLVVSLAQSSDWSTQTKRTGSINMYNYIGSWVHVAATWQAGSSNSIKFYVNGVEDTSYALNITGASSIRNSSNPFYISGSKWNGSVGSTFDGLMDEVRVWNDVRTSTEISDSMLVSLDGTESNLVGYWNLNNNSDDKTSNNNDLTLTGSPTYSEEPAHALMCSFTGMF